MKMIRIALLVSAASVAAAQTPASPPAPVNASTSRIEVAFDPAVLREQNRAAIDRVISEFLDEGRPSADAVTAYQLSRSFAERQGIRITRVPLRTKDERNLGSALLVQKLESLGCGYDRIYHLNLSKR